MRYPAFAVLIGRSGSESIGKKTKPEFLCSDWLRQRTQVKYNVGSQEFSLRFSPPCRVSEKPLSANDH